RHLRDPAHDRRAGGNAGDPGPAGRRLHPACGAPHQQRPDPRTGTPAKTRRRRPAQAGPARIRRLQRRVPCPGARHRRQQLHGAADRAPAPPDQSLPAPPPGPGEPHGAILARASGADPGPGRARRPQRHAGGRGPCALRRRVPAPRRPGPSRKMGVRQARTLQLAERPSQPLVRHLHAALEHPTISIIRRLFMTTRRFTRRVLAALALSIAPLALHAAEPLRLVVGFAPGGGVDTLARVTAQALGQELNRTVIVENKSGAGGTIAADYVAKSQPDGNTVLFADTSLLVAPYIYPALRYDLQRDFITAGMVGQSDLALAVPGNSPIKTVAE